MNQKLVNGNYIISKNKKCIDSVSFTSVYQNTIWKNTLKIKNIISSFYKFLK